MKKMMKLEPHGNNSVAQPFLTIAVALTFAASSAQAVVIAQYPFTSASAVSTDTELSSTAGNFLKKPGETLNHWVISSAAGNAVAQSRATAGSEADALTDGDYWSFIVIPEAGFTLDLTSLTFDTQHNATAGNGDQITTATMSVFLRSSIDNYASNIGSTFTQDWNTGPTDRSIDLSAPAFQDITTATTFRMYVFDSGVNTASNGLRLDNVVLNGDVVPEPSAALLGALGALCLLRRRR